MAVPTVSSEVPELAIPAPRPQGWLAHIRRLLVGDDVFISYARKDASRYALALATELTKEKLSCFLDQWGAAPHATLPPGLTERLRRSSVMVVIASPAGAESTFVAQEIAIFRPLGRPVVLVSIDDAEEGAPWWPHVEGLEQGEETHANLADATPAPWVFAKIRGAVGFHTRRRRLRRGLYGTALLLSLALVGVLLASRAALRQEKRARALALANEAAELADTDPAGALRAALISMDTDGSLRSRRVLSDVLRRHDRLARVFRASVNEAVTGIAFSPDGALLATVGEFERLRIWDAATLHELPASSPPQRGAATEMGPATGALAFTPDGRWLLTGHVGHVTVWRVADRTPVSRFQVAGTVDALALRRDGLVAVNGRGERVRVLRLDTSGQLRETASVSLPPAQDLRVQALAFGPVDGRLAIGSSGGVYLADVEQPADFRTVHVDPAGLLIERVSFSPDGATLVVSELGGRVSLWSTESWTRLLVADRVRPEGETLAFGADGTLLTGSSAGLLRAFEPDSVHRLELRGTTGTWPAGIAALAVSPDGRTLASGSRDGMVTLWNLDGPQWLRRDLHPGVRAPGAITMDGGGRRFLARFGRAGLGVWHVHTARSVPLHPRAEAGVLDAAGTRAVVAWRDSLAVYALNGRAPVISASAVTEIANPEEVHVSGDGRVVVVRGDSAAFAWDTRAKRGAGRVAGVTRVLALSPDGRRLAIEEEFGFLALANVDGTARRRLWGESGGRASVRAAVFTRGGRELLSFHENGVILRWRLQGPRPDSAVVDTVLNPSASATARFRVRAQFSADGRVIAIKPGNRPVIVWDIAAGTPLLTVADPSRLGARVALSGDGSRLVVGEDSTAYAIDLSLREWVLAACSILSAPANPADRVASICQNAVEEDKRGGRLR